MRKFFANMTIRSSLLWVLAFFSFMLVIGAALGVLSLRISNATLAEIKQSQEPVSYTHLQCHSRLA